jgi:hypothetical protein
MTYEYKYLSASSIMSPSPKQEWLNDFQANLDDGFYEGFDWYTIEEEVDFGSGQLLVFLRTNAETTGNKFCLKTLTTQPGLDIFISLMTTTGL